MSRQQLIKNYFKQLIKPWLRAVGYDTHYWVKTVMYRECFNFLKEINLSQLNTLEISPGNNPHWKKLGFKSYTEGNYPEFDICKDCLNRTFDIIIADQVFEHLLWPYRAGRNVYQMLEPGGYFIISTPFLIRVHDVPVDCSRWTELGLKYLLAECGFSIEQIETGSWGNRECINANFKKWKRRGWNSLRNEPNFPVTVWAIAKK